MESFRVGCVQMCSGPDPDDAIAQACALIREAESRGAQWVLTPECTNLLEPRRRHLMDKVHTEDADPGLRRLQSLAEELGIWLGIGGMALRIGRDRLCNRSFLIAPDGSIAARYDKIHLFDVTLPDGTAFRESQTYTAGREAVLASVPWGTVGLTICYDLRFPSLYRLLARAGAAFLTVPSAFARVTGEAHWHVLLRARAIENGAFVFAPAQCGVHRGGRESYGHTLIVDPWGEVLADGGEDIGVVMADIRPDQVELVRRQLPVLQSERPVGLSG